MKQHVSVTSLISKQDNLRTNIDADKYIGDSFLKGDKSVTRLMNDDIVVFKSVPPSMAHFMPIPQPPKNFSPHVKTDSSRLKIKKP
jgi:hypothetical protein